MARPGSVVTRSFSASAATRPTPHSAAVPPPAVATSRPTTQFTRHHDVTAPQVDSTAFRQGWRVATRLDALLEAGRIDREAWDFAHEWRRWAETIVPSRVQQWAIRVDMPAASARDAGMLWRIAAATKLRESGEALGPLRVKLLEASVLHDLSWRAIATQLRCSDKTALDRVAEAVAALADWRCGRIVPPPPVMRYRIEPGRQ
jgi:hypothetical protein